MTKSMRIELALSGTWALCFALLPWGCGTAEPGSAPGSVECYLDTECQRDLSYWSEPNGSVQLVAAACHIPTFLGGGQQPFCECQLRRTPQPRPGESPDPYVFSAWPGNRPGGCSEYARTPGCSYCEREFPGCNIDDAASCDAVCADFTEREQREFARTFSVRERLALCSAQHTCEHLYELEGKCYVGELSRFEARAHDCSLSDAELLAQSTSAETPSCAPRAEVSCASASDCPGGLACKDGVCGPCVQQCQGSVESAGNGPI